jgi:hypothetical protein
MKAYKFLLPGAVGPFSGHPWPAPEAGRPGPWVDAGAEHLVRCRLAVHACRVAHLPWWIHDELWEVELAEPVRQVGHKLIAPRGRLVRRCDGWDREAAERFAGACARRAADWAAQALAAADGRAEEARVSVTMAADAATRAAQGHAATAAYIAAHAAHQVGGPEAMAEERRRQASWFGERLALTG